MKIRDYKESDFKRLCEIHDEARLNELKASHLENAFVPLEMAYKTEGLFDYTVKVLEVDNQVLGFVAYSSEEFAWLYVDPKAGRKGYGKALVDYVKSQEKRLILEVIKDNTPAISFYKKQGFTIIGEESGNMPGNEEYFITVLEMEYVYD